jgi:PAS domain S-box-containing protein
MAGNRKIIAPAPAALAVVRSTRTILWRSLAVVSVASALGVILISSLGIQNVYLAMLLESVLIAILCLPGIFRAILRPATELAAEQATAGAEARFQVMANAVNDAIILYEPNKLILFANRAAERMHGYAPGELLGRSLEVLIPEDDRQRFRASLRQHLDGASGTIIGKGLAEVYALRKNGEQFPIELNVSALLDRAGVHFIAVLREITARKQAEDSLRASEKKFRSFLESLPVAVRIIQGTQFVFANPADALLHGFESPDQEFALGPDLQIAPCDLPRVNNYALRRAAGEEVPSRYELRRRRADGSEFPAELRVARILYNGAPASLVVIRDLSESKLIAMYEKLLPVCCVCGKIRDDSAAAPGAGDWERLDQYLCKHSDTQFTHTFCPSCFEGYKKQNLVR